MDVVGTGSALGEIRDRLAASGPTGIELIEVDSEGRGGDVSEVEVILRADLSRSGLERVLTRAPKVRWLHSIAAGVEHLPLDRLTERGILLTNGAGIFAIPLAEWVLATMLRVVKDTDAVAAAQRERRWESSVSGAELYDSTLLVLGSGGIGAEIISRAAAFGMRIFASNRTGREVPGADRVVSGDGWRGLLPEVDFLVCALPLTDDTRGMIGESELAALPDSAWVINVGRGATIDERALIRDVAAGTLGGAALDAWITEPLPADHPAWTTDHLIISPHKAGSSPASTARGYDLFVDNLRRFQRGAPLRNQVDPDAGY